MAGEWLSTVLALLPHLAQCPSPGFCLGTRVWTPSWGRSGSWWEADPSSPGSPDRMAAALLHSVPGNRA